MVKLSKAENRILDINLFLLFAAVASVTVAVCWANPYTLTLMLVLICAGAIFHVFKAAPIYHKIVKGEE